MAYCDKRAKPHGKSPHPGRCLRLRGHPGGHRYKAEIYMLWELSGGVVPTNSILVPKNGNYADIRLDNFQVMPRKQRWRAVSARRERRQERGWFERDGEWFKTCIDCGQAYPAELFGRRNRCPECWKAKKREAAWTKYQETHPNARQKQRRLL